MAEIKNIYATFSNFRTTCAFLFASKEFEWKNPLQHYGLENTKPVLYQEIWTHNEQHGQRS